MLADSKEACTIPTKAHDRNTRHPLLNTVASKMRSARARAGASLALIAGILGAHRAKDERSEDDEVC